MDLINRSDQVGEGMVPAERAESGCVEWCGVGEGELGTGDILAWWLMWHQVVGSAMLCLLWCISFIIEAKIP